MSDLEALRESLDRLAHWMESVVSALDRHSAQLARHERQLQLLQDEGHGQPGEWPREVLALTGASSAAQARERLAAWKASHERETALLKELREAGEQAPAPRPARSFGMPEIDLHSSQISPDVIQLVPREVAERCQCIPVLRIGRSNLLIATSVPLMSEQSAAVATEIERVTGLTAELLAASSDALREALAKYYPASQDAS